jgi:hypothetical protein
MIFYGKSVPLSNQYLTSPATLEGRGEPLSHLSGGRKPVISLSYCKHIPKHTAFILYLNSKFSLLNYFKSTQKAIFSIGVELKQSILVLYDAYFLIPFFAYFYAILFFVISIFNIELGSYKRI